jgi:hypothetical protein
MQPTPLGWYWDPGNRPGLFRWWDGHAWTNDLTARHDTPPPRPPDLPEADEDGRFRSAALSFPRLPDPWTPSPPYTDLGDARGQELVVGKTPRGPYLASVVLGMLPEHVGYTGPDALEGSGTAYADRLLHTFYPHERPHDPPAPEPTSYGGRPAWQLVVPLDIDDDNLDFAWEDAVLVLVALDGAQAGVLFASLPRVPDVPGAAEVLADLAVEAP